MWGVDRPAGQRGHPLGGVQNGPVPGAPAQVARQVLPGHIARDGLATDHPVLVHAEQAHHKAGGAKAALAAMALHHGLLGRVQGAVGRGNVFRSPHRHAIHRMGQPDAAVDGPGFELAIACFAHHHGAGAAVAFAAALLGAGVAQVLAQHLQQRAVGWYIGQRYRLAAADELQGAHGREVTADDCGRSRVERAAPRDISLAL